MQGNNGMTAEGQKLLSGGCPKCIHVPVCAVYRAIAPLIENSFPKDAKPFNPNDLFKICNYYTSIANQTTTE